MTTDDPRSASFVAALAYVMFMVVIVCLMLAAGFDDSSWMTFLFVNGAFAVGYYLGEPEDEAAEILSFGEPHGRFGGCRTRFSPG